MCRVLRRLRGGRAAAVLQVEAGFDDRREGAFGDGRVPAQGGTGDVGGVPGAREFPSEVADQAVRGVAAVRRLLQEGHVDEAVERVLGTGLVGAVGAEEAGDEGDAVGGQVEGADAAQGEGGVAVGPAAGGGEGVVGNGQGAADGEVVVLQVPQPVLGGGQLVGEDVGGEGLTGGQARGYDAEGKGEAAGEFYEGVGGVYGGGGGDAIGIGGDGSDGSDGVDVISGAAVGAGTAPAVSSRHRAQQLRALLGRERGEREAVGIVEGGQGERLVTITAQPAPAGSSGRTCAALAASSSTMSVRVGASSERSNAAAASGCSGMLRGSAPRSRSRAVRAWAGVRGVIPGVAPCRLT